MDEILKLFSVRDILFHMINTAILLLAVTFLVYKPARKFLKAREDRVNAQIDEAKAGQEQAEALKAEAARVRHDADLGAAEAQKEGAASAQQTVERMIADARLKADAIVKKAQADAAEIKAAAREDVQEQALTMAVEIAEKMIGRELSEKDNAALAREFLTKVV